MADLKFVSWKEIFLKALDESDRDKAAKLVHEADLAIYKRQRELGDSPLHREELSTMSVAAEALRVTRRMIEAHTLWVRADEISTHNQHLVIERAIIEGAIRPTTGAEQG